MTMGSYLSYCCLPGSPTAPGQLDIASMHAVYGAASLSEKTSRFALLGHPVRQSPSHRTHSKLLRNFGIDGLYVKIPVQQEEASEILPLLKALGFSGASVTTPLKQDLGSCLLPINTIKWTAGEVQTKNTDAPSLVEALAVRFPLKGARVLILGAGAVGISAARSLTDAGSTVAMYNRTFSKASRVASLYGAIAIDETELLRPTQAYDVVVNATSAHASATFPSVFSLLPLREWGTQVVAEFAISSKTPFLLLAEQQGMRSISGQELWARQAAKQFQWWCGINELLAFQFLQEELACR